MFIIVLHICIFLSNTKFLFCFRTIDLRSCYGFKWSKLTKFLRRSSHKLLIHHVHLDNCYWLDWSHDVRFLRSCPNLCSLTLLGVPVTLSQLLPIFNACKQVHGVYVQLVLLLKLFLNKLLSQISFYFVCIQHIFRNE